MIKVKNNRVWGGGNLFHYAHFICDCLFPEIICDIFNYNEVVRLKNIDQTIGNFSKIYNDVMMIKNTELLIDDFNNLKVNTISYKPKEECTDKIYFDKFRNYIFKRYDIKYLEYEDDYPEVILIKRNDRVNLIDDEYLQKLNTNITNGKERREIKDIIDIELFLQKKYKNKFKSLYFENLPFKEQIKYFNNSKLIICAHGAVMSNMFFCKEGTKIIEVVCDNGWPFFDKISNILKLNHIKCHTNDYYSIIKCIE
tara:strand:+ start:87 stop:848 length:762 start_codon:yes stop_codon:yes gene_type:complete